MIANESKEVIYIRLDPSLHVSEKKNLRSVNVIGTSGFLSFGLPESTFANAMITVKPNEFKVVWNTQFLVCPPGTKAGKFFNHPFCSANEVLTVFAETNFNYLVGGASNHQRHDGKTLSLKSGIEFLVVEGIPKFQVGRATANSGEKNH